MAAGAGRAGTAAGVPPWPSAAPGAAQGCLHEQSGTHTWRQAAAPEAQPRVDDATAALMAAAAARGKRCRKYASSRGPLRLTGRVSSLSGLTDRWPPVAIRDQRCSRPSGGHKEVHIYGLSLAEARASRPGRMHACGEHGPQAGVHA